MFLRECKCTIVTLLSMLIYKSFTLRIGWKVFCRVSKRAKAQKLTPALYSLSL